MRKFNNKIKPKLTLLIIATLLLQLALPIYASNKDIEGYFVEDQTEDEEAAYIAEDDVQPVETDKSNEGKADSPEGEESEPENVLETSDKEAEDKTDHTPKGADGVKDEFQKDQDADVTVEQSQKDIKPLGEGDGDSTDLGNIFSNFKLKVNDVEIDGDTTLVIEEDTTVVFELDWKLDDEVVLKEGDYARIKLPDALKGIDERLTGDLKDGDVVVGSYEIDDDNYLRVIFNDELVGKNERNGKVGMLLEFDLKEFENDNQQVIKLGDPVEKEFTITLKPKGDHKVIEKTGKPDKDINAEYIDWVIDINKTFDAIEDARVEDEIPYGLALVHGSIEVYKLTVGYDGVVKEETKLDKNPSGFPVELGNINSAYRIKYKTKIVDYDQNGYRNQATIYEGDNLKGSAEYNVGKITKGSMIEKNGEPNDNGYNSTKISWTIDINKAEQDLKDVLVREVDMTEGLTVNGDSIKIYRLNKVGANWVKGEDITGTIAGLNPDGLTFPINLGDLNKKAYRIEFDTDIEYGNYNPSNVFSNKAELIVDEKTKDEAEGKVIVNRGSLIEKSGKETTLYDDPHITWTIVVNNANHLIKDTTITDTIGAGLKLREGSIKIKDKAGNEVDLKNSPEIPYLEEVADNKFVLKLGDINSKYTIEYITDIIDPEEVNLTNEVGLWGDGLNGIGIKDGIIKTPEVNPGNSVKNIYRKDTLQGKTFGDGENIVEYDGIDYEEKTMSWAITIDALKEKITELTLEDSFNPEGSMVFLKDTLRVVKLVDKKEELLTEGTDYTVGDKGKDGFELSFLGGLDRTKYRVYYKTSFDPDIVLGTDGKLNESTKYENKVKFTGKTEYLEKEKVINEEDKADYTIKEDIFNGGKKDGELNREGRKIAWKIYVNAMAQDLTGEKFVITDKLSEGQVFDEESLIVKEYSLDKDGNIKIYDDKEVEKGDYIVAKTGDGFTLTIANGIDKPYVIEYNTKIEGISKPSYKNTAITGKDTNKPYEKEVEYQYHDKFVVKGTPNLGGNIAYTDDEINWVVTLNESLSEIKNAVFKDTISPGHVYVEGSLKLYKGSIDDANLVELKEGNPTVIIDDETGVTELELSLGNIDSVYIVTYDTVVVATGGEGQDKISNKASLSGEKLDNAKTSEKTFTARQSSWGTGSGRDDRGSIKIVKVDAETGDIIANNPAKFKLYYLLNDKEQIVTGDSRLTENGEIGYGNLPFRTYYLEEIEAPSGYKLLDKKIEIVINKDTLNENRTIEIKVENTKEKTDITGKKEWVDGPEEKPSIELQLYRNGEAYEDPVMLESGETEYTWEGLDKTDIDGKEYTYTVDEITVLENYIKKAEGLTVINTYVSPKTEVTGKKQWDGGPEEKPSIELQLKRNGEDFGDPVTLANGETEYTWTDLDKTDKNGVDYEYTVDEVEVPENYKKTIEGLTVINTYVSPKTEVTGYKLWEKGPKDNRPDVKLQLYQNGKEFGEPVTLKNGETEYTWTGLDLTDKNGEEYVYTIDEVEVPENYGKSLSDDRLTVTNTYGSPRVDIVGRKVWDGGPKEKPTIKLQLYRNGEPIEEPVELEDGKFEHVWEGLDKTDEDGVDYIYTVDEVETPEDYEKTLDGLTVINTYVSPKTEIKGTKVWVNGPEEKPEIELQLYRNGEAFGKSVTIKSGGDGKIWTDLDLNDRDGVEYVYTIDEVKVPENYEKTISEDGLTVTNTYVSPEIEITGRKVWVGGPEEKPTVELQLYRNGEVFGEPVILADGETEYTWVGLDKTDENGVEFKYTVDEVEVPENYEKTVSEDGLTITNSYVSPKIDVTGKKVWIDGPEEKPAIKLQLYRNGQAFGEPVTLAEGKTEYTWTGLDKTDENGVELEYSVDELDVPENYEKTISEDGLTITNTYKPEDIDGIEDPEKPEPPLQRRTTEDRRDPYDRFLYSGCSTHICGSVDGKT